jgi:glycosyltransferase involved in cell wall biosynthesis
MPGPHLLPPDASDPAGTEAPQVSVVVAALNERQTLRSLAHQVRDVLERRGLPFEIIIIDDGSTDGSDAILRELFVEDARFRSRILSRRHGKSAALDLGLGLARGERVVLMDADLQDLPEEMPILLDALDLGLDLVQGRREVRNDALFKVVASWVFNRLASWFSGLPMRDVNCGYKAMRKEVAQRLRLGDDMHRFVPILAHRAGFRVGEAAVRHAARAFGRSRYGPMRYLRGLNDLVGVVLFPRVLHAVAPMLGPAGAMLALLAGPAALLGLFRWGLDALAALVLGMAMLSLGLLALALAYLDRTRFSEEQAHQSGRQEVRAGWG